MVYVRATAKALSFSDKARPRDLISSRCFPLAPSPASALIWSGGSYKQEKHTHTLWYRSSLLYNTLVKSPPSPPILLNQSCAHAGSDKAGIRNYKSLSSGWNTAGRSSVEYKAIVAEDGEIKTGRKSRWCFWNQKSWSNMPLCHSLAGYEQRGCVIVPLPAIW